jgi:hypothetical protein
MAVQPELNRGYRLQDSIDTLQDSIDTELRVSLLRIPSGTVVTGSFRKTSIA